MANTSFDSPHGMMNKHNYSTAYDIAKLSSKCMKNEYFRKIVNTQIYECKSLNYCGIDGKRKAFRWENTNKLLGVEGY